MDEQRLWRNEDVENERRGNDGDSFQLMRENKRERERKKVAAQAASFIN